MRPTETQSRLLLMGFALVLSLEMFLVLSNVGLDLADEGFLWVGVDSIFRGLVPILDFRSYDPGRYYWGSMVCSWVGPGLISLRFSLFLFQALSLFLAFDTARRLKLGRWEWLLLGPCLTLWMFPYYKVFEQGMAILTLWAAVRVLEDPRPRNWAWAGACAGVAIWFGRQIGAYALLTYFGLAVLRFPGLPKTGRLRALAAVAGGLLVGLLPLEVMLVSIRGFAGAYLASFLENIRLGSNGYILTPPWPWKLNLWHGWTVSTFSHAAISILFLAVPLSGLWGLGGLWRSRADRRSPDPGQARWMGAVLTGIPWFHYAFYRGDITHLFPALQVLTLGILAVAGRKIRVRRFLLALLLLASGSIAWSEFQLGGILLKYGKWDRITLRGQSLHLQPETIRVIRSVQQVVLPRLGPGENAAFFPLLAGLYPSLDLATPVWDTYVSYPASDRQQARMIGDLGIHRVTWVVVAEASFDGRDDLTFERLDPVVWAYLLGHYDRIAVPAAPAYLMWFHLRPDIPKSKSGHGAGGGGLKE